MQFDADVMQGNLRLIAQRWPRVLEQLPEPDSIQSLDFELVGNTPRPALRVNGIQLVSAYDPEAEARLQAQMVNKRAEAIWVYGVGGGYLPRRLLKRQALRSLHYTIMNRELFVMLLAIYDHRSWLSDKRTELHIPVLTDNLHSPFTLEPACLPLADDFASRLRDQVEAELDVVLINERFADEKAEIDERINELAPYLARDGDVGELFGRWKDNTAAVVAPGPTLVDGFAAIRELQQGGSPVIAVDAAAAPLLAENIVPDVLVAIDRRPEIYDSLAEHMAKMADTTLVYYPILDPRIPEHWQGRGLIAYSNAPYFTELAKTQPRAKLWDAGTVSSTALDLAVQGGAAEVGLFGIDLAFPGDQYYAPNSGHDYLEAMTRGGRATGERWVVDGNGQRIRSVNNFVLYLRHIERYIAGKPQVRFVNMSRKGAYIHGAIYPDEIQ